MVQESSWKTRDFRNEAGSIGEKVAKKWREKRGYSVYFFKYIMGGFTNLHNTRLRMKRRRKQEYRENDKKIIHKIEKDLMDVFGQKFEAMRKFDEAIRNLANEEEENRKSLRTKKTRAIGFDFVAKKDSNIFFIDVKVNQAKLGKYQKLSSKITKELGFKAMVLRLDVEIEIGKSIQLIECKLL